MKIKTTVILKDYDGEAIIDGTKKQPISLRDACINALNTMTDKDRSMDGKEKFELFELSLKLKKDEVELKAEEIAKIKKRVGMIYTPIVVGRVDELLEGK